MLLNDNTMIVKTITAVSLAIALVSVECAAAASEDGASRWFETNQNKVRLISASKGIPNLNKVQLGLQFVLKDNWKIYWRSPGDAGFPPRLDWKQSRNLKRVDFDWPAPTRFEVLGLQTIGYKREVVFPIRASVINPRKELKLSAELNYLICDDICIPHKTNLSLILPPGNSGKTKHIDIIRKFASKIPEQGPAAGFSVDRVEIAGDLNYVGNGVRKGIVRVTTKSTIPFVNPDIFMEGPKLVFFSLPNITISKTSKESTFLFPMSVEGDAKILRTDLILTITDRNRAMTEKHNVQTGPPLSFHASNRQLSYLILLFFAFVGGAILNLMPCVLPVISLKILSFSSLSGANTSVVRNSFIATSAGIIFSSCFRLP